MVICNGQIWRRRAHRARPRCEKMALRAAECGGEPKANQQRRGQPVAAGDVDDGLCFSVLRERAQSLNGGEYGRGRCSLAAHADDACEFRPALSANPRPHARPAARSPRRMLAYAQGRSRPPCSLALIRDEIRTFI